jgi:hypothetical protein
MLKMLGLSSALQFIIHGLAIAAGMALARFQLSDIMGAWRAAGKR